MPISHHELEKQVWYKSVFRTNACSRNSSTLKPNFYSCLKWVPSSRRFVRGTVLLNIGSFLQVRRRTTANSRAMNPPFLLFLLASVVVTVAAEVLRLVSPPDLRLTHPDITYSIKDQYCWILAHTAVRVGEHVYIDGGMAKYRVMRDREPVGVCDLNGHTVKLSLEKDFDVDYPNLKLVAKKDPGVPVTTRGSLWVDGEDLLMQGGHFPDHPRYVGVECLFESGVRGIGLTDWIAGILRFGTRTRRKYQATRYGASPPTSSQRKLGGGIVIISRATETLSEPSPGPLPVRTPNVSGLGQFYPLMLLA